MDVKGFGGWPCDFSATCGLLVCIQGDASNESKRYTLCYHSTLTSAPLMGTGTGSACFCPSAARRTKLLPRFGLTRTARVRAWFFRHGVLPSSGESYESARNRTNPVPCLTVVYSIQPCLHVRTTPEEPYQQPARRLYIPRCFLRIGESLMAGFAGASAAACLKAAVASS
jgi:hypothetical protein